MYKHFKSFLFRTPYFPFSSLKQFEKRQNESVFNEMLQIATLDLIDGFNKGEDKALYSTYRYFQRACTRPTPFGLFAGCSLGTIEGEKTTITLKKQQEYKRYTRLDMNFICAFIQQIEREKKIREQLNYYPNNSLYPVGNFHRYVIYSYEKNRRIHKISQIETSEYLQKVLITANNGALFSELVDILLDDEISVEDAVEFIQELIDIQVLVSELQPSVTNVRPLNLLISRLKMLSNSESQIINTLSAIDNQLNNIDQIPIGKTAGYYSDIIKLIEKFKLETEIKYLFQTDLYKPTKNANVSKYMIKDIHHALVFLNKITQTYNQSNLSRFKENFVKRYEQMEMPLLFVLDNEIGIGYGDNSSGDISPLIDDLTMPLGFSNYNSSRISIQSVIFQKIQQSNQNIIELTDEDVKGVESKWDDLPPTISVVCEILKDDEKGRKFYIKSVSGMSAASLLGRFCHLDERIFNHTLSITEKEAQMNPNVIFAEIVHLPESRIGNILLRPVLRPFEIPYLAKEGVSEEFVLRLDDLYISVQNDRIRLLSKRLDKEIVPRMSTAHNFSGQSPMPVYHFLCDMQHQSGRTALWFGLSEMTQQLNYFPRIVYKNCILSQARWIVRKSEIKE